MTFVLAMSPQVGRSMLRAADLPPVGEASNLQPPNLLTGPGVSPGAPYTVDVNGDVYFVSRNSGSYRPDMCIFNAGTEVGRSYRFKIFEVSASHDYRLQINGVLLDNGSALDFVAQGPATQIYVAPTASVIATIQFERPECRLVA